MGLRHEPGLKVLQVGTVGAQGLAGWHSGRRRRVFFENTLRGSVDSYRFAGKRICWGVNLGKGGRLGIRLTAKRPGKFLELMSPKSIRTV